VVVEQVVVVLLLGHGLLCSSKKDQIYASMQSYQGGELMCFLDGKLCCQMASIYRVGMDDAMT
jgi:hypothetical protein